MKTIHIVHLYPKEMNIYGDNGNILVLQKRLSWRGVQSVVHHVGVGEKFPANVHIILGGGGQDTGQSVIAEDLQQKADQLKKYAEAGVPMLMICGMYQMFGHYFKTASGQKLPGIGLIDVHTIAGNTRIIGNIIETTNDWGTLVGYENHSGRTVLGKSAHMLGETKPNQGNNGTDNSEGAVQLNIYGSYLHGPMLAKSPMFADHLLSLALSVAGENTKLKALDDSLEHLAAKVAQKRQR
jgi:lipid II isoglutaminyl synthase (glutamine-hydrolysing)